MEVREEGWRKEDFPLDTEGWVRDWLGRLMCHKSMGPDGIYPEVPRKLADVAAKVLSITFEKSWRTGEAPDEWTKANVTLILQKEENLGNYWLVSSTPGKVMEQIILEVMTKHVKEKVVTRSSQHGFTKGKSC